MRKKGMAAQFVEVTLEEMDKFLKRGFRALRPTKGTKSGEVYYDLKLSPHVGVRVWTSIRPHSGMGADVGADAIRVQLVSLKDQGPLERGKAPIVKRTQGWRNSLQDRIEELVEKYEDKEEFWDNWAATRQRSGNPEREMQRQEVEERREEREQAEEEHGTVPTAVPTYQRSIPLEKLKGDITPPQVKFILSLYRNFNQQDWERLKLDEVSGFSRIPTREQLETLSKRQGSQILDILLAAGYGNRRRYAELRDTEKSG